MKSRKLVLTTATLLIGLCVLTGCNSQTQIPQTTTQETTMEETNIEEMNIKETVSDAPTADTSSWTFDVKIDEATNQEYGILSVKNENGAEWTYETEIYDVSQCTQLEKLTSPEDVIYINEAGTIIAFDKATGSILWKNSDYQGSGTTCILDDNGTLYACGYLTPDLFVMGRDGATLFREEQFHPDYFWPYEMTLANDTLTILFESEENASISVNINDYSYTF